MIIHKHQFASLLLVALYPFDLVQVGGDTFKKLFTDTQLEKNIQLKIRTSMKAYLFNVFQTIAKIRELEVQRLPFQFPDIVR